ncbi:MAG: hypothetical protein LQ351_006774 [Letrouitia transgressa]|nr:MAG: hypothetical protein LQ351_006774 [Letrouitia transgressa]
MSTVDKEAPMGPSSSSDQEKHFTVFIRLPFPRGDFVDPPPVKWDAAKDQRLWDILSRASKGHEIDWLAMADQFDVDISFLLQQASWLYERQLSQVKAQLRKVNRRSSIGNSPTPGSVSGSGTAGGQAMARVGSGGARVPSALSIRQKERPLSQGEGSMAGLSPPSRAKPSPPTGHWPEPESPSSATRSVGAREGSRKSSDPAPKPRIVSLERDESISSKAEDSLSSSSSESESSAPLSRSRAYMRRPRFSNSKAPLGPLSDADEDEDEEDSPPFLPFSDPDAAKPATADPSETLRVAKQTLPKPSRTMGPLHSSSSSAQSQPQRNVNSNKLPMSPVRGSGEPASALSPRQRRVVKEGSDGSPSMGSSFSDLDDASITQSALEEALANEMNHGSMASRMSTISQALRSRYL